MFRGSITALVTPFKDGKIDWKAFDNLVEWQIEQGSHGLVPCGTTGESPTLSHDEHMAIVKRCVDVVKGRIPVIAGTGSNSTSEAIELSVAAKDAGADAHLSVVPYYNKPSQAGMIAHFTAIADAAALPMILYNIPGRSVVDMGNETIATLAKHKHIVGVKDATGNVARVAELVAMAGKDFCQLSGNDDCVAGFLAQGGHGVISVVSNVAPRMHADMVEAWEAGDLKTFAALRDKLAPLARDLFCESSPAPVKYAAQRLGLCRDELRLPLIPASEAARAKVDAALAHAGLSVASKASAA
ncbi:MAG TPA: 4-hydroxy-tetrahydrodipicolinate synthase [Alphaproteobacteria bacterium]|nr:4-hydroxy-tetrahydrodipicolinate synthase [Alphaproteobacteria bacterium]USO06617.1 MAG: 4-hydroxy-tetrahydrodipicolinate synthase [Rhodospirillales bacterium]HOO80958.1 4-hydroxy-tetrahydrodipicolinate synthase [Alphaproteobacteria bacterium]